MPDIAQLESFNNLSTIFTESTPFGFDSSTSLPGVQSGLIDSLQQSNSLFSESSSGSALPFTTTLDTTVTLQPSSIFDGAGNSNEQFNDTDGMTIEPLGNSALVEPLQQGDSLLSRSSSSNTPPVSQEGAAISDLAERTEFNDSSGGIETLSFTPETEITLQFSSAFGSTGSGNGQFNGAGGVAIAPSGNVYVSDGNNRIQVFDRNGAFLHAFGSPGSGNGEFNGPWSLAVAPSGNVYVADFGNNRIQVFDGSGNFLFNFGSRGNWDGYFHQPTGVTVDNSGKVYVTDANNRIQTFDSNGNFLSSLSAFHDGIWQFINPELIAVDESGNIYVPGNATHNLTIYNKNGEIIRTIGGEPGSENGQFLHPQGVALDSRGNIYIADSGNNRVQIFDRNGNFLSSFGYFGYGNTEFGHVKGIAVDKSGRTYVADGHNRIQIFDPDAGNTPDQATRVNVASNGKTYQGWVDSTDPDDFYSFSLGARNDFSLSLDGLSADANVQLLDINGNVILSSTNAGTAAESINSTLEAGAYRIHVTSADTIGTTFNLNLSVTPLLQMN
jgi:streptogramin lyase